MHDGVAAALAQRLEHVLGEHEVLANVLDPPDDRPFADDRIVLSRRPFGQLVVADPHLLADHGELRQGLASPFPGGLRVLTPPSPAVRAARLLDLLVGRGGRQVERRRRQLFFVDRTTDRTRDGRQLLRPTPEQHLAIRLELSLLDFQPCIPLLALLA